jgi:hypothetical protein
MLNQRVGMTRVSNKANECKRETRDVAIVSSIRKEPRTPGLGFKMIVATKCPTIIQRAEEIRLSGQN